MMAARVISRWKSCGEPVPVLGAKVKTDVMGNLYKGPEQQLITLASSCANLSWIGT